MKIRGQTVYTAEERIDRQSIPEPMSGCWIWLGATSKNTCGQEYGQIVIGSREDGSRRFIRAHRLSYEVFKGAIPEGLFVCHRCDNTLCVNPDHLFVGTHQDNVDDRERKGRNKAPPLMRGETSPSAKYSDALVDTIRSSPLSSRVLGAQLGIDGAYIRQIRRGVFRRPAPPVESKSEVVG